MDREEYVKLRNKHKDDIFSFLFSYYKINGGYLNAPEFTAYFQNWRIRNFGIIDEIMQRLDIKNEVILVVDLKNKTLLSII